MSRRLISLTVDNLDNLPARCRSCVFWELHPAAAAQSECAGEAAAAKESWISQTLLEWGGCGVQVMVDGVCAGYATYAPPAYVPRAEAFATAPASADSVLLMTAWVAPEYRGAGLGRMLIQGVVRGAARRGVRAVEAFGRPAATIPGREITCLIPTEYLRAVGFKTVRPHHATPRMRLDVRSTVRWREDVEQAIERLISGIQRPSGVAGLSMAAEEPPPPSN